MRHPLFLTVLYHVESKSILKLFDVNEALCNNFTGAGKRLLDTLLGFLYDREAEEKKAEEKTMLVCLSKLLNQKCMCKN